MWLQALSMCQVDWKSPMKIWRTYKAPYGLLPSFLSKPTQDDFATCTWPSTQSRHFATFLTCHFLLHIWFLLLEMPFLFLYAQALATHPVKPMSSFNTTFFRNTSCTSQHVRNIIACRAFLPLPYYFIIFSLHVFKHLRSKNLVFYFFTPSICIYRQ